MEQYILYIVIDYRDRHWKGITIKNVAEVNWQQKLFLYWTKMYFSNTAERSKQYTIFNIKLLWILKIVLFTFSELPFISLKWTSLIEHA